MKGEKQTFPTRAKERVLTGLSYLPAAGVVALIGSAAFIGLPALSRSLDDAREQRDPFERVAEGPVSSSTLDRALYLHNSQTDEMQLSRISEIKGAHDISIEASGALAAMNAVAARNDDCVLTEVEVARPAFGSVEVASVSLKDDSVSEPSCRDEVLEFLRLNKARLGLRVVEPKSGDDGSEKISVASSEYSLAA